MHRRPNSGRRIQNLTVGAQEPVRRGARPNGSPPVSELGQFERQGVYLQSDRSRGDFESFRVDEVAVERRISISGDPEISCIAPPAGGAILQGSPDGTVTADDAEAIAFPDEEAIALEIGGGGGHGNPKRQHQRRDPPLTQARQKAAGRRFTFLVEEAGSGILPLCVSMVPELRSRWDRLSHKTSIRAALDLRNHCSPATMASRMPAAKLIFSFAK